MSRSPSASTGSIVEDPVGVQSDDEEEVPAETQLIGGGKNIGGSPLLAARSAQSDDEDDVPLGETQLIGGKIIKKSLV
jgi:hypothetical protein